MTAVYCFSQVTILLRENKYRLQTKTYGNHETTGKKEVQQKTYGNATYTKILKYNWHIPDFVQHILRKQ